VQPDVIWRSDLKGEDVVFVVGPPDQHGRRPVGEDEPPWAGSCRRARGRFAGTDVPFIGQLAAQVEEIVTRRGLFDQCACRFQVRAFVGSSS